MVFLYIQSIKNSIHVLLLILSFVKFFFQHFREFLSIFILLTFYAKIFIDISQYIRKIKFPIYLLKLIFSPLYTGFPISLVT